MKKRVLVTGGAGFIGSFICERLIEEGHYVICCDNFYTGTKNNLVNILDNKRISIFNNNESILKNSKYSEVLIYNFEDKSFKKKFQKSLENNLFINFSQYAMMQYDFLNMSQNPHI